MNRMLRRLHEQRGIATVEFAICAPVLFLLMLATAELGRAMFQYNTLIKAVRDGARYAAGASTSSQRIVVITDQVRNETRNLVVTGNVGGAGAPLLTGLTVNNVTLNNVGNGFISVSATYTFTPMLGATLPTFGLGPAINLSMTFPATVVMRVLV